MPKLVTMIKDTCRADVDPKAVKGYEKAGWKQAPKTTAKSTAAKK